jgi:uncharacterized membrane protein YeiB
VSDQKTEPLGAGQVMIIVIASLGFIAIIIKWLIAEIDVPYGIITLFSIFFGAGVGIPIAQRRRKQGESDE